MRFDGKCKLCGSQDGIVTDKGNMCRVINCYAYMVPIPEDATEKDIKKILKTRIKARRKYGKRKYNRRNSS